MKVSELIEELEGFDPEAEVKIIPDSSDPARQRSIGLVDVYTKTGDVTIE